MASCEDKYTTQLDLARQSKIITGNTACFDGKIQAGIPFSGYPTGVDLSTVVSLGVVSTESAVISGNNVTTLFDVANPTAPGYDPSFDYLSGVTWTNPLFQLNVSGLTLPITPLSADTQTVGPVWTLTQTGMTGDNIIGTQYTGYSITYSPYNVTGELSGSSAVYLWVSGFTSAVQENFSAGTLDYKGPVDYLRSREDATVDNRLTTKKLRVTGGASASTIGYVLTQVDEIGTAEWVFNSASADTNTFVTSGVLNINDELELTYNTGGSVPPIDLSALRFTGNTSGDCINELWVDTISGCSDTITIGSNIQSATSSAGNSNNFVFASNSTIQNGNDNAIIIGGNTNRITILGPGNATNSAIVGGGNNLINVGGVNSAIVGGQDNVIESTVRRSVILGGDSLTATTDETVYVPKFNINEAPNDNTLTQVLVLDSNGDVKYRDASSISADTNTFVTGGTLNEDTLTLTRNDGVDIVVTGFSTTFTGNTSGDCISDLWVSNIHSCSPLNINPLDEGNVYYGSTSGVTIDVINSRIGIGTDSPTEKLHVEGGDILINNSSGNFSTEIENANGPVAKLSGSTTELTRFEVNLQSVNDGSLALGIRGSNEISFSTFGKQKDSFIRSSDDNNGLNLISAPGVGTDDYIRFYAGQTAVPANTPDMIIIGTGGTRGNVGINTSNPIEKLHVQDGNILALHDQDGTSFIGIKNFDTGVDARASLHAVVRGEDGIDSSGVFCMFGTGYTGTAGFSGEYLPNSLTLATGGGADAQRAHVNIGSRRTDGQIRFFTGDEDYDNNSLLGIWDPSGLTLSGSSHTFKLNTDTIQIRNGAVGGHVLTATDSEGNASWQPASGGGTFTGNTSGDCINELWVSNISGCTGEDLHIGVQPGQDIYFDSTGGTSNPNLYINSKGQIGVGTNDPFNWAPNDGTGIEIYNESSVDNQIPFAVTEAGSRKFYIETDFGTTSDPVHWKGSGSGTNLMTFYTVSSRARVGVGTTVPDGTFQIAKAGSIANQTKYPDETNIVINNTSNGYSGDTDPYSSAFRFDHGTGEDPGGLITSKRLPTWDSGEKSTTLEIWNASGETNFRRIEIRPEWNTNIFGDITVKYGGVFFTQLNASFGPWARVSGTTTDLIQIGVTQDSAQGITIGTRGETEPTYDGYGKQGDGFLYSSAEQNGLNIISANGTGTEDYIKFYGGTQANATAAVTIVGSGTTKGFVGIGIETPTAKLHVQDGNELIDWDENSTTKLTIQNLDNAGTSANSAINLIGYGTGGNAISGFINYGGINYTNPSGTFQGNYITNALNIGTGGGTPADRADINIGSRKLDGKIRFFGSNTLGQVDDFNDNTLVGTFYYTGLTITDMVNTDTLRVRDGATNGYVLTSDASGVGSWQPSTGGGSFTGNTSGDCISDLWVSNIHSCSPLNINPGDEGNVYYGSTSGVTIDVSNSRIGIGTDDPDFPLHIVSTNQVEVKIESSTNNAFLTLSSSNGTNSYIDYEDGSGDRWIVGAHGGDDEKFKWATGSTFASDTVMTLTRDAKLGIGTSAPQANLHIKGITPPIEDNIFLLEDSAGNVVMGANDEGALAIGVDPHDIAMSGESSLFIKGDSSTTTGEFDDQNIALRVVNSSNNNILVVKNGNGVNSDGTVAINGTWNGGPFSSTAALSIYGSEAGSATTLNALVVGDSNTNTLLTLDNSGVLNVSPRHEYGTLNVGGSYFGESAKLHVALNDQPSDWNNFFGGNSKMVIVDGLSDVFPYTAQSSNIFVVDNFGNVDVKKRTTTENFTMTSGATDGYVLTSDASGNARWEPPTGGAGAMSFTVEGDAGTPFTITSGDTLTFEGSTGIDAQVAATDRVLIAVDYSGLDSVIMAASNGTGITVDRANDKLLLYDDSTATVKYINADQLSFTGNTSGDCINELWVTTISGCSPVTIGSSIQSLGSTASGIGSIAYGQGNVASGEYSQAFGKTTTATGSTAHAQGEDTMAYGQDSHAEGKGTTASGDQSHAEGGLSVASGAQSHAEGAATVASGEQSHAEGEQSVASGTTSHAQGGFTIAGNLGSHAEGIESKSFGVASHAEGAATEALGDGSHSEGQDTTASGNNSHAEGFGTEAGGSASHAEGFSTEASGEYSHSEGFGTLASGSTSHAEGKFTIAGGEGSHAGGYGHTSGIEILSTGLASFAHFHLGETSVSSGVEGDYSAILGGRDHSIGVDNTDSIIIGGQWNGITGHSGTYNSIIGGIRNVIGDKSGVGVSPVNKSVIIGGQVNYIECTGGDARDNAIISSFSSFMSLRNAQGHVILGGNDHEMTLSGKEGNAIIGGTRHSISGEYSAIIGGNTNDIGAAFSNTVILGGSGITAVADDTVYVPNLNIGSFPVAVPQTNLSIDSSGNVVQGFSWGDSTVTAGNSSGDCITELWVTDVESCSPLYINRNNQGDIYIGEESGAPLITMEITAPNEPAIYFGEESFIRYKENEKKLIIGEEEAAGKVVVEVEGDEILDVEKSRTRIVEGDLETEDGNIIVKSGNSKTVIIEDIPDVSGANLGTNIDGEIIDIPSDSRVKEIVQELPLAVDPLEFISHVKAYQFKWLPKTRIGDPNKLHYGFKVDDFRDDLISSTGQNLNADQKKVNEVAKSMVEKTKRKFMFGNNTQPEHVDKMNYEDLIPFMVEGIKALNVNMTNLSSVSSGGAKKYVNVHTLSKGNTERITHNLDEEDVIVQLLSESGEMVIPERVSNYLSNSVDIDVSVTSNYKIIIMG